MLKPSLAAYFADYADAHRHPVNRLTHKIAIPLIVLHVIAMLDWVRLIALPTPLGPITHLTLGHIGYLGAVLFYFMQSGKLAVLMALLFAACFPIGWRLPWQAVVAIAIVGWGVQLAGHSVWEKNRPAFLQNMFQALIGPMFFVALITGDWPVREAAPSPRA
jgi:uncharacterized membrane protein YGL010W